jgi:hypothetical protein
MGREGHHHTVRSPREMLPTNFRVETILEAMISIRRLQSE